MMSYSYISHSVVCFIGKIPPHKNVFSFAKKMLFLNFIAIHIYSQQQSSCEREKRKSSCSAYKNETSQHEPLMNRAKSDHYSKWKHEHTHKGREHCRHFQLFFLLSHYRTWSFHWRQRWTCTKVQFYMYCIGSASIRFNLSFMINAV